MSYGVLSHPKTRNGCPNRWPLLELPTTQQADPAKNLSSKFQPEVLIFDSCQRGKQDWRGAGDYHADTILLDRPSIL